MEYIVYTPVLELEKEEPTNSLSVFVLRLPHRPQDNQSTSESYYFVAAVNPQDAMDIAYANTGYSFKGSKGTRIQNILKLPPEEVDELLRVVNCTQGINITGFKANGLLGRRNDGTEIYVSLDENRKPRVTVSSNHPYSQCSRRVLTT